MQYEVAAHGNDLHLLVKYGFYATALLPIVLRVSEVTRRAKIVCGLLHVNSQSPAKIHLMNVRKDLITFMLKEEIERPLEYGECLLVSWHASLLVWGLTPELSRGAQWQAACEA